MSGDPVWKFHPWPFLKRRPATATLKTFSVPPTDDEFEGVLRYYKWPYSLGGAQIVVSDVNGDGLPDIISSLDAHGYGLAWFEQLPGSLPISSICWAKMARFNAEQTAPLPRLLPRPLLHAPTESADLFGSCRQYLFDLCVKISRHTESVAIPIRSKVGGHPVVRDAYAVCPLLNQNSYRRV